jgi:hypothetical protein
MDKLITDDSCYKIIYQLPSQSLLEFDFSFKKGDNYQTTLYQNFEQESIPKILLDDIKILMHQCQVEERKDKRILSQQLKEDMNSKYFQNNVSSNWLGVKTFMDHLECIFY